jgi:hypothetical protein
MLIYAFLEYETIKSVRVVPSGVGEKIRAMRTNLGLAQAQLAGRELSTPYVSAR